MTSTLYKNMKTDEQLSSEGVTFELYGNRITMARAGLGNPLFQSTMTKLTQAFRRQIAAGTMDPEQELSILRQGYASAVIKNWEVNVGPKDKPEWKVGIESPNGDVVPFTKDNVIQTLTNLPELFLELQQLATTALHYRAAQLEDDSGN